MVTRGSRNHLSGINLSPLYRRSFKQLHPPRIATLLCRRRIDLALSLIRLPDGSERRPTPVVQDLQSMLPLVSTGFRFVTGYWVLGTGYWELF